MDSKQRRIYKNICDECESGEIGNYGMTIADFKVFRVVVSDLNKTGRSEFIQSGCIYPLELCGFKIKTKGIGWEVREA